MSKIKARTLFAFMFYGVFLYLVILGREVPDPLVGIVGIIMGHYFGERFPNKT